MLCSKGKRKMFVDFRSNEDITGMDDCMIDFVIDVNTRGEFEVVSATRVDTGEGVPDADIDTLLARTSFNDTALRACETWFAELENFGIDRCLDY